jgi:hypothetical protein
MSKAFQHTGQLALDIDNAGDSIADGAISHAPLGDLAERSARCRFKRHDVPVFLLKSLQSRHERREAWLHEGFHTADSAR